MNSHAQAGLEYLMTYGWALVIIVTVVGVLFAVISPPTSSFTCASSNPKIILESYNVPYSKNWVQTTCSSGDCEGWGYSPYGDTPGKMVLINATGGAIRITKAENPISYIPQNPPGSCTYISIFGPECINNVPITDLDSKKPGVNSGNKIILGGSAGFCPGSALQNDVALVHVPSGACSLSSVSFPATNTFRIFYTDQFGINRDFNVTCNGYPPKT